LQYNNEYYLKIGNRLNYWQPYSGIATGILKSSVFKNKKLYFEF